MSDDQENTGFDWVPEALERLLHDDIFATPGDNQYRAGPQDTTAASP